LTTSLFSLGAKLETAKLLGSIPRLDTSSLMQTSVNEWVNSRVSRPEVRDLIHATFRVATYANAPNLLSAGAAIEQVKKALDKSVLYLDGGWQSLVDGLMESAKRAGVIIDTGVRVEMVERNPMGSVERVRLSHARTYFAPNVIIASSPATAVLLVQNGEQTILTDWASDSVPIRAACLDVALKHLPNPKATFALGMDRPLYLSVHSTAARLAPSGAALVHLARYQAPDHQSRPDLDKRELEDLFDLVQPGWRELVVHQRFLPEMTVANGLVLARTSGQRPGPKVPDVPGLFVVGDWVGNEGMLADASLSSARQAAEMIASQSSYSVSGSAFGGA
jgi:phytoene dehydrogenase-like protein